MTARTESYALNSSHRLTLGKQSAGDAANPSNLANRGIPATTTTTAVPTAAPSTRPVIAADDPLSGVVQRLTGLTNQLVLGALEKNAGLEDIVGITMFGGFLPGDPERLICGDWREGRKGW